MKVFADEAVGIVRSLGPPQGVGIIGMKIPFGRSQYIIDQNADRGQQDQTGDGQVAYLFEGRWPGGRVMRCHVGLSPRGIPFRH